MNSWTISPRLFRYLKEQVIQCNNLQFQLVVTMKRLGSDDQTLTLTSPLSLEQCSKLEEVMELNPKAMVVFRSLYEI